MANGNVCSNILGYLPMVATLVPRVCDLQFQLTRKSLEKQRKQLSASNQERSNNVQEKIELDAAKKGETIIRKQRPKDINSEDYTNWQLKYNDAQEEYKETEADVEFKFEQINKELEEEVAREESRIDREVAMLQSQLEVAKTQLDSSKENFSPRGAVA